MTCETEVGIAVGIAVTFPLAAMLAEIIEATSVGIVAEVLAFTLAIIDEAWP